MGTLTRNLLTKEERKNENTYLSIYYTYIYMSIGEGERGTKLQSNPLQETYAWIKQLFQDRQRWKELGSFGICI